MTPIITLLSDFGLKDPYVAEMKAVILSICPKAKIVDISHEIEKYNVRMGAFILASAAQFFPAGAVHVAVVDPGVGGERRPLVVETKRFAFVGPDNGVLILAARSDGIRRVYHITNRRYMREKISATFHGRDIFSPVAAHIASGVRFEKVGKEVTDYVTPEFSRAEIRNNTMECEIIHVDDFGNIITNAHLNLVKKFGIKRGCPLMLRHKGKTRRLKYGVTYSDVQPNDLLALIGSHFFLEVAVNQGNAARILKAKVGEKLTITSAARLVDLS